jgi:tripartite-type tricarboxylate transporter receptor subunit TctC
VRVARIGSALVAKSAPDGYTVLLGAPGTLVAQPVFHDDIEYQPLRDFVYTSMISLVASALLVHPSMPVRSVKEIITFAGSRPGALLMGSAGQGSGTHLMGELFQSMAKVKFVHVPLQRRDLPQRSPSSAGQVHLSFDQISSSGPFIKAGRLRALAVTTPQRSKLLPDVPTIDESGLRGYDYSTWTTLGIPAATPKEVVQKLRDAVDSRHCATAHARSVRETRRRSRTQLRRGVHAQTAAGLRKVGPHPQGNRDQESISHSPASPTTRAYRAATKGDQAAAIFSSG